MALTFSIFDKHPELIYGFSEKSDGSMRLPTDDKIVGPIYENRLKYFSQYKIPLNRITQGRLIHGSHVEIVDENQAGKIIPQTDSLITKSANIFLATSHADGKTKL
jgi:copper oxidase (laccase) domain-containing protein